MDAVLSAWGFPSPPFLCAYPTAWTGSSGWWQRWKKQLEVGARCPPAQAVRGRCLGAQGGGTQCPSAASHNPTATCRRWNGKIPLAKLAGPFGKAQLWVNRLCGAPAWRSRFVFIPILYPADSCRPACPCGAAAGSAGRRPKRRVNIGVPEKGLRSRSSSFAASLLLLWTGGGSSESARWWGQRGPGTQTMSPSCHRHAGAPAAGVSPSQGLVDGGFALSGCTSAVFAGGARRPAPLPPPAPSGAETAPGTAGMPRGGVCPPLRHPQLAGAGTRTSAVGETGTDLSPSLLIPPTGLFPANPRAGPDLFSASSSSSSSSLPRQAAHALTWLLQRSSRQTWPRSHMEKGVQDRLRQAHLVLDGHLSPSGWAPRGC